MLTAAGPSVVAEAAVTDAPVPPAVGAALAAALAESLTNVARHAGPVRARMHAGPTGAAG